MEFLASTAETIGFNYVTSKPPLAAGTDAACSESSDNISEMTINQRTFGIRVADTEEGRNRASMLVNKMYAWRGYAGSHRIEDHPNRITLSASDQGAVIGTVTLGIDSSVGLLADEVFSDQIDVFRERGARVCEISKLAFDPTVRSKMALGSLFHILYIYAHHLHKCTDAFIEVNPRHRRYYETMLGFRTQTGVRNNPRVDAPAHLMWLSLDYMSEQIERMGGSSDHPGVERSLYPYFFSRREELGIASRLFSIG
jgi:hypothetical protein